MGLSHVFQSTPSGGKATRWSLEYQYRLDVSIHAFRGEGDNGILRNKEVFRVSIHAFRGEGDAPLLVAEADQSGFNPRLPGGRRLDIWRYS